MNKLILIDGNAILHRAYHALPTSLSRNGVVVNAVYGFFSMFLKILEEQKPEYVIVCFDRAATTFRQELFAGYHENRPKMADDLVPQVGIIHEVLEVMKVAIFEVDGYEADDLIGTLAKQATEDTKILRYKDTKKKENEQKDHKKEEKKAPNILISQYPNIDVIIVTGDRDMLQLVNSHVKVLMPITGITKMVLMDEQSVEEKYGVTSAQFVDYKALIGDASDNYPGVTGIGPKTAANLLQKFNSFENLYQHLSDLPEKQATMLATDAEQAALAKKLATIVTDAPITLHVDKCSIAHLDKQAAAEMFRKLGMKSLVARVSAGEETASNVAMQKVEKVSHFAKASRDKREVRKGAASAKSSGEPSQLNLLD